MHLSVLNSLSSRKREIRLLREYAPVSLHKSWAMSQYESLRTTDTKKEAAKLRVILDFSDYRLVVISGFESEVDEVLWIKREVSPENERQRIRGPLVCALSVPMVWDFLYTQLGVDPFNTWNGLTLLFTKVTGLKAFWLEVLYLMYDSPLHIPKTK